MGGNDYEKKSVELYAGVRVRKPVSRISEESTGNRYEYDANGNKIYCESPDDYWEKSEYDENGNLIYKEASDGYWAKYIILEI